MKRILAFLVAVIMVISLAACAATVECDECGDEVDEEDSHSVKGDVLCDDCYDDYREEKKKKQEGSGDGVSLGDILGGLLGGDDDSADDGYAYPDDDYDYEYGVDTAYDDDYDYEYDAYPDDDYVYEDDYDYPEESGVLWVAIDPNLYSYDQLYCIDILVSQEIAKRLGKGFNILETGDPGVMSNFLMAGDADIGISALTIEDGVQMYVDFSDPYMNNTLYVVARKDSSIKSVTDLHSMATSIGVREGSIAHMYAGGVYRDQIKAIYGGCDGWLDLVSAGFLDCVIISKEEADTYLESFSDLCVVGTYMNVDYRIAVSKSNPQLLSDINRVIREMKHDGTIDALIDKYIVVD